MARLFWKGRGRLITDQGDIYYDDEISDVVQKSLGRDRIEQLTIAGKIGKATDQEIADKARQRAGARAAKAVKARPPAHPGALPAQTTEPEPAIAAGPKG
jgi:hypothetical protein